MNGTFRYLLGLMFTVVTIGSIALGQNQVENFNTVTDEMLQSPADGDWLMWRRNYAAWGYSPLDQIDTSNVQDLELAWAWTMRDGRQETTPLVHDGIMYLHNYGDVVQALDGASGDLIWEYQRVLPGALAENPGSASLLRGMALAGDYLFLATADVAVVALDARTGQEVWATAVGNYNFGFSITGGVLVVKDKVITGVSGCGGAQPGGCYVVALDRDTGDIAWRVNTIAAPGSPDDSWNGVPLENRFGSSAWNIGSFDPELNLVYWSTGQPYPWNYEMAGLHPLKDGERNEALYTNSTLAIDPDTGELKWFHQYLATDTLDLDYAYEQILVDLPINGETRKALVNTGKLGIVEAIDRTTGEWLWARETVYQNVVSSIDQTTGEKTINQEAMPIIGQTTVNCPADPGSRSWAATAYSPLTQTLYLPMQEFCSDTTVNTLAPGEVYTGGGRQTYSRRAIPDSDGNMGVVNAVNLATHDITWSHRMRPANGGSAALVTGGNLVFTGNLGRYIMAFDATTGDKLWERKLSSVPNGYPISYEADGEQYIAVPVGFGSGPARAFSVLTPEIVNVAGGSALYVFKVGSNP